MTRPPLALVLSALFALSPTWAENHAAKSAEHTALPSVDPAQVGLSAERLARIDKVMQNHVDEGRIPGAIGLIARRGKVAYLSTWGYSDREAKKEMSPSALFRMYSMTAFERSSEFFLSNMYLFMFIPKADFGSLLFKRIIL